MATAYYHRYNKWDTIYINPNIMINYPNPNIMINYPNPNIILNSPNPCVIVDTSEEIKFRKKNLSVILEKLSPFSRNIDKVIRKRLNYD